MQRKRALILYHWRTVWWPCVTGMEHGCNGSDYVCSLLSDVTHSGHTSTTPLPPKATVQVII